MVPLRRCSLLRNKRGSVYPMVKPNFRKALEQLRRNTPSASSSANVHSDPAYIACFQSYLKCPFYLIMDFETEFCLRIKPKTLALAIIHSYQLDMKGIITTLSEAIFSEEDYVFKNFYFVESTVLDTEQHRLLYERKKGVITRAAYWLWTNVGSDVNLFGHIPINEHEPLDIPPELQQEIDSGFESYSPVSDEDNELPFMRLGITEQENRCRIYKHPLKNNEFMDQLTLNVERVQDLTMEEMFGTFAGLFMTSQVVAWNNFCKTEFEDTVDILQVLTHALFESDPKYSDTFFGSVQVGNDELRVLEGRRSRGLSEIVRSLFRMVYRRYNNGTDPQIPNSSFKNLKSDDSAAVLLVAVMIAAKYISMIPETIKLTDWNTTDNLHNDTVLLYPSRSEFVDIFKKLRDVWGNARFSDTAEQVPIVEPEVNVPIGFNDNHEVPLVVDILPVIETWVLQCGTDNNGDKYLSFQDPDKVHVHFNIFRLKGTWKKMKESMKISGTGSPTSPESSRRSSPEYQGGRYLLVNVFDKDTVLAMSKSTKDTPEGIALTRMLMCLKSDLESTPADAESQFITLAKNMKPNDIIHVPRANNLHGEINIWLFCEYVRQLKNLKRYPVYPMDRD